VSGSHGPRHGSVADALYVPGSSALHRLPPHVALVGAVGFVVAVVATPPAWQAYAGFAVVLAGLAAVARVPYALVLQRSVVELPFVAFALLLPFVATGPHTEVLGLSVSSSGLADGATLLARATLGVWTSILLAATQRPVALLRGLERLRVPGVLVQIAGLMLRYLEVVLGEMRRMRVAREARGFRARDLRQLPTLAHAAGSLFIRSYERGERVHLAMLSRGYQGSMPDLGAVTDPRRRPARAPDAGARPRVPAHA